MVRGAVIHGPRRRGPARRRSMSQGLNRMWADQANWPEGPQQSFGIRPELQKWITTAIKG